MTPLQLSKYAEFKKEFKRDVICMNTKCQKKMATYNYRVETARMAASNYNEVDISNSIKVFFYNY